MINYPLTKDDLIEIAARLLKCDKSRIAIRQKYLQFRYVYTDSVNYCDEQISVIEQKSNTVYFCGEISCTMQNVDGRIVSFIGNITEELDRVLFTTSINPSPVSTNLDVGFCTRIDASFINEVNHAMLKVLMTGIYFEFNLI